MYLHAKTWRHNRAVRRRGAHPAEETTSHGPHPMTRTPNVTTFSLSRRHACFFFAMAFALMLLDYIDRLIVVSMFPHLKAEWDLGGEQSVGWWVVSITVAARYLPALAHCRSLELRKSIFPMATVGSGDDFVRFTCNVWATVRRARRHRVG